MMNVMNTIHDVHHHNRENERARRRMCVQRHWWCGGGADSHRDHLVVNALHDKRRMSDGSEFREAFSGDAVVNSYRLVQNLPNAVLLTYPDAGHGSLFQYHDSFARHAAAFLSVSSESAVY
jgi:pimeloyl-ACP methyl ester carboxylesterase